MERHLRLHPGQEALTPAQEAEARRFAEKQIEAQLSSAPRDEQQAEQVLRQIYQAATYPPPTRIVWLDGPLPLVALRAPVTVVWSYMQTYDQDASVLESMTRVLDSLEPAVGMDPGTVGGIVSNGFLQYSVWNRLRASMGARLLESVRESVQALVQASVGDRVGTLVQESMWHSEPGSVISEQDNVWASLRASVGARLSQDDWDSLQDGAWNNVREDALYSVRAYADASEFALFHYFDVYLAPQ